MKTSTIPEGQLVVSCLHLLYEATCTLMEAHNLAFAARIDSTKLICELDQRKVTKRQI